MAGLCSRKLCFMLTTRPGSRTVHTNTTAGQSGLVRRAAVSNQSSMYLRQDDTLFAMHSSQAAGKSLVSCTLSLLD